MKRFHLNEGYQFFTMLYSYNYANQRIKDDATKMMMGHQG